MERESKLIGGNVVRMGETYKIFYIKLLGIMTIGGGL